MKKGAITAQGMSVVIKILIGFFLFVAIFAIAAGGTETVTAKITEYKDCFKNFPICLLL